jgi:hypothetical protein
MRRKSKKPREVIQREHNNVPVARDLEKKKEELEKHLARLELGVDGSFQSKPITEAFIKGLIRSAVGAYWMRSPLKLAFKLSKMQPDYDQSNRRRFKGQCSMCGGWFTDAGLDVDHVDPVISLDLDDVRGYVNSYLSRSFTHFQLLCNDKTETNCHGVKTIGDSLSIPYSCVSSYLAYAHAEKTKGVDVKAYLKYTYPHIGASDLTNKEKRRAFVISELSPAHECV